MRFYYNYSIFRSNVSLKFINLVSRAFLFIKFFQLILIYMTNRETQINTNSLSFFLILKPQLAFLKSKTSSKLAGTSYCLFHWEINQKA